ncbi:hypothetical protein [Leeia sp.]|uniref:hypothetical protein n=1 Tax=Leeia sp. TaxID=2884678 RepID=UPI0035B05620
MLRYSLLLLCLAMPLQSATLPVQRLDQHAASGRVRAEMVETAQGCTTVTLRYRQQVLHSQGCYVLSGPDAYWADLDFDHHADLWLRGCTDGQCRSIRSEVWRFQPSRQRLQYDAALSALPNLRLAQNEHRLESGIDNAGCAGQAFHYERYWLPNGILRPLSRRIQECLADGRIRYQEHAWQDGRWVTTLSREGAPSEAEEAARRSGGLHTLP